MYVKKKKSPIARQSVRQQNNHGGHGKVMCCLLCRRFDPSGNSARQSLEFDKENNGAVVDMAYFDTGG